MAFLMNRQAFWIAHNPVSKKGICSLHAHVKWPEICYGQSKSV